MIVLLRSVAEGCENGLIFAPCGNRNGKISQSCQTVSTVGAFDRVGRELHGFLAAVVLEPFEHGIAMPEPVHVAGRQLGTEGIV